MSEIKNRERILDAIDQLRRRKARPDIHRICNFLTRRFAIDSNEVKSDLQRCVEREIVLKVEYKGSISYRNAARKFSHLTREQPNFIPPDFAVINASQRDTKKNFASILSNAIAELIVQEPDYLELGVPGPELVRKILSKDGVVCTRKYIQLLLQIEVENGGLIKMENGHYSMGPSQNDSDKSEEDAVQEDEPPEVQLPTKIKKKPGPKPGLKRLLNDSKNQNNETNGNGYRVGCRRKRAKKVFDPSDNNIPRIIRKRGRPAGSLSMVAVDKNLTKNDADSSRPGSSASSFSGKDNQGGVCSVCHNHGKKTTNEKMVHCRECSNKAHFSCLSGEEGVLRMYPDNTWQCPHCKTCVICYETSDAGYLTVCSICADAYHLNCHDPNIPEKNITKGTKWICINCQMPNNLNPIEFKPKPLDDNEEKLSSRVPSKSCTPSVSGQSSPSNYRSLPPSPIPPTLSPHGVTHNGGRQSRSSSEYKFNLSDSQSMKDFDLEENVDPSIPDASKWSFDEVYKYFAQYFPEEASVFKEQEIDGPSLLLMKRLDVLTSLKLKLGPALKIYRHVLKLQVRRDDPKLYWL